MNGKKRLWNKNFAILWQGQLISDFGNAAFSVALGFWVLEMTKSPAMPDGNLGLMGTVMACFSLPRVVVSPFTGALADRLSRKWIIVAADFMRGLLYTAMGVTVFFHVFPFAAIFPIAVLASICDGFFNPALSAALPDIVPQEQLTKANSARSASTSVSQLVGNAFGGVLYAALSAPRLILFNGLSFLYAALTQLFMKIPAVRRTAGKKQFLADMADGVKYTLSNRGLRSLLTMCFITNFFAVIGITLLTPLFKSTPGFGVERYGFMMGAMMAGAVLGMLTLSILKIKPAMRARLFNASLVITVCTVIPIGFLYNVNVIYPLSFVMGVCNAIVNMMIQTILQATVPAEHRGKVFGIVGTFSGALMPLAMAVSGFIASAVGVRPTIVGSFVALTVIGAPFLFDRHFRAFINTDIAAAPAAAEVSTPEGPEEMPAAVPQEEI